MLHCLNYESKQNYTLTVKITDDDAEAKTAQIIIQINRTRGAGTLDERLLAFFITNFVCFHSLSLLLLLEFSLWG
jgi:hypothetical protein